MVSRHTSVPGRFGFDSQCSKKNSAEKIVDVAEVNQQRSYEESGQWIENVD